MSINFFNYRLKSISIYSFVIIFSTLILTTNCTTTEKDKSYKSNFEGVSTRTWIGSEYWANPMQDWQIDANRIECLVSNENRNIHHLTRQLGSQKGTFETLCFSKS